MTKAEIHALGVRVAAADLREEGFVIEEAHADFKTDSQIIARHGDRRLFVAARTGCYPGRGLLEPSAYLRLIAHAIAHDAYPSFASIGICNIRGATEEERGLPLRDGAIVVYCTSFVCLTSPNQARVAGFQREASPAMLGACRLFALMLNTLDVSHIEPYLAEDVTYSSHWAAETVLGKEGFVAYFNGTFRKMKDEGSKIWAEIAYTDAFKTTSCVIGAVRNRRRLDMTTLIDVDSEGRIACARTGEHPPPFTCLRTGEMPSAELSLNAYSGQRDQSFRRRLPRRSERSDAGSCLMAS